MQIAEFQQWIKNTDRNTQWDLLTTLQLLSHLTEEVGELAQSINRIYRYPGEKDVHLGNLRGELVDVLWFLIKIANKFEVDLNAEAERFVKRERDEKYKSELVRGLQVLDKELSAAKREIDLSEEVS
jgi:NTP pyrophosphatase (non-canonical NTP hydrolase)